MIFDACFGGVSPPGVIQEIKPEARIYVVKQTMLFYLDLVHEVFDKTKFNKALMRTGCVLIEMSILTNI